MVSWLMHGEQQCMCFGPILLQFRMHFVPSASVFSLQTLACLTAVQVDLGGCLCEHSWLRPFAAALGWVDAYVERMLMAVVLVKDEVSHQLHHTAIWAAYCIDAVEQSMPQQALVGGYKGVAGHSGMHGNIFAGDFKLPLV